ncbi:MAG TPA: 30S ribosomal protein S12 methylthiotransferase RimO [Bacteroidales bacterium]|nr:30S ribosomal protein S12 methylthiotransferase RimO [Bacteroidales bacterium]
MDKNNFYLKKLKIAIITLGCPKNTVDSEYIAGTLKNAGFNVFHAYSHINADAVIINTCAFILDAKQESIDVILECIQAKNKNQLKYIFVIGCMVKYYMHELQKALPEVDAFWEFNINNNIVNKLANKIINKNDRLLSTPKHYAYLKISEGCNRKCSFCLIPQIRGKYQSNTIENLIEEANKLANKGVKEIILVAQDTTFYGKDIYKKNKLAELLRAISNIENIQWIRLHYAYPANFPKDVINEIFENPKICKYIDIPLQHINDNILKSMQRGITKQDTIKLIELLRKKIPKIGIRTTFIVGFPGETKKEYEELKIFVKEMRFERMGIFTYSREKGTKSYSLKNNVPNFIKKQRAEELMLIQQEISLENNLSLIGKTIKVIIDRKEGEYYIGRTEYDSPEIDNEVLITSNKKIDIGTFIEVKITKAEEFDIYAKY